MKTPREAAEMWRQVQTAYQPRSWPTDREAYLNGLEQWAGMYVRGYWSLERFEAHADQMMAWLLDQEARPPP